MVEIKAKRERRAIDPDVGAKATVQMNMRVTEDVRKLLIEVANHEKIPMSGAIEAAIRAYHKKKVR